MHKYGWTFLTTAAQHGKSNIVNLLIRKGVDVKIPPKFHFCDSYVISAVSSGDLDTLKTILENGCSIKDKSFIAISKL